MPSGLRRRPFTTSPREVGAVFEGYSVDERTVLFDFFARAAPAFREATDEIRRASSAGRRRRS